MNDVGVVKNESVKKCVNLDNQFFFVKIPVSKHQKNDRKQENNEFHYERLYKNTALTVNFQFANYRLLLHEEARSGRPPERRRCTGEQNITATA